ncbi:hypothetical protein [Krasilnikovia sp. MM14-A1004]|uniref:hypothetical protein n=1 Tax=Krasilnikovia sp. MM14-A1004 TaxID=3373541 RepID=UPI00399CF12B
MHHRLRTLVQRRATRHTQTVDELGYGYSRDTTPAAIAVPDGVDLYFFTGRTRREALR